MLIKHIKQLVVLHMKVRVSFFFLLAKSIETLASILVFLT